MNPFLFVFAGAGIALTLRVAKVSLDPDSDQSIATDIFLWGCIGGYWYLIYAAWKG